MPDLSRIPVDSDAADYKPAHGFYSALGRTIRHIRKVAGADGTIRPDQALTWLAARQRDGWFKLSELQWSGLEDWLKAQQASVHVSDIIGFVRDNGVRVHEVVKGADPEPARRGQQLAESHGHVWDSLSVTDQRRYTQRAAGHALVDPVPTETKYAKYTLPGGAQYRELLLTLPEVSPRDLNTIAQAMYGRRFSDLEDDEANKVVTAETSEEKARNYKSTHWSERNIIAHVRFNERLDATGARVLFIEELQSDWAQEGLKSGFGTNSVEQAGEWWNIKNQRGLVVDQQDTKERAEQVASRMRSIPAAPFVTDTKAWLSLSVKRIIQYAVEHGYDRVAFITGEQSAQRYDLSKVVESVEYRQRTEGPKQGTGLLTAYDHSGNQVFSKVDARPSDLADAIGQEAAARLMQSPGPGYMGSSDKAYVLAGESLKVGGDGMREFYDRIVPQAVNDVLKKLGGGRVGQVHLITETDLQAGSTYSGTELTADELTDLLRTNSSLSSSDSYRISTVRNKMLDGMSFRQAMEQYGSTSAAEAVGGSLVSNAPQPKPQVGFDISPALRASVEEGMPLFSRFTPQRSELTLAAAGAAAHTAPAGAGARLGRARPIRMATARARVAPHIEQILRDGRASGEASENGLLLLQRALQEVAQAGPDDFRALAVKVERLLPRAGSMRLTIDDTSLAPNNGVVHLEPHVDMHLYTAEGRTGLAYETLLHEALHVGVAVRYKSLAFEAARAGRQSAAAAAIDQFHQVWREFCSVAAGERIDNAELALAVREACRSPDEFFVRTMTDPLLQDYLASRQYNGKTLWQRFSEWILTSLFGADSQSLAPSWLDAALTASHDLADAMQYDTDGFDYLNGRVATKGPGSAAPDTRSAFKRWFGDSKVARRGKPTVVYHGTLSSFDAFDPAMLGGHTDHPTADFGFFFSSDPRVASIFTLAVENLDESDLDPRPDYYHQAAALMPVYLSIQNPKVISAGAFIELVERCTGREVRALREQYEQEGHDGILIRRARKYRNAETVGDTWVAFKPEQIKSATGNRGSFDPRDPSILASLRAEAPQPAADQTADEDDLDAATSSSRPG